jgi:hypothetical protein
MPVERWLYTVPLRSLFRRDEVERELDTDVRESAAFFAWLRGPRSRLSQRLGLGDDSGTEGRVNASVREDIHLPVKEIFEVLAQPDQVEQGASCFHFHEQVEIAVWTVLTASGRAEEPDISSSVACGDSQDVVPFVMQVHRVRSVGIHRVSYEDPGAVTRPFALSSVSSDCSPEAGAKTSQGMSVLYLRRVH